MVVVYYNHVYIDHDREEWLKALNSDKLLVFKASNEAQKAVKYILG